MSHDSSEPPTPPVASTVTPREEARAILHSSDRKLRKALLVAALVPVAFVIVAIYYWARLKIALGPDGRELLMQFLVVTTGGGILLALITNAREEHARRQDWAAMIQALDRELDRAYRTLKKTRRRLRAFAESDPPCSTPIPPFRLPAGVLEAEMADFLHAQLELEGICDHLGQRNDIISPTRIARMKPVLHYASRYYYDVHEDFERKRLVRSGKFYDSTKAYNLNDYLASAKLGKSQMPSEMTTHLDQLSNDRLSLDARAAALEALLEVSPYEPTDPGMPVSKGRRRFGKVAGACFDLISDELYQARADALGMGKPAVQALFRQASAPATHETNSGSSD